MGDQYTRDPHHQTDRLHLKTSKGAGKSPVRITAPDEILRNVAVGKTAQLTYKPEGLEDWLMPEPVEYRYIIDVFTLETLPMARLAEYMGELAQLLGEREHVHFERLEAGSAVLVTRVDVTAVPKVETRVHGLRDGTAPPEVFTAFRKLDSMLESDNAVAQLFDGSGAEVIEFPGRTRPKPIIFGPFNQHGTLDGVLTRIGGSGKTVYAQLTDAERSYTCALSRDFAKQMAPYLFGPTLRVHGRGRWLRDGEGVWHLERFKVFGFDVLDDRSLAELVSELRAMPSGWDEFGDPWGELARLRGNGD